MFKVGHRTDGLDAYCQNSDTEYSLFPHRLSVALHCGGGQDSVCSRAARHLFSIRARRGTGEGREREDATGKLPALVSSDLGDEREEMPG